jgi:hypothetical protein
MKEEKEQENIQFQIILFKISAFWTTCPSSGVDNDQALGDECTTFGSNLTA